MHETTGRIEPTGPWYRRRWRWTYEELNHTTGRWVPVFMGTAETKQRAREAVDFARQVYAEMNLRTREDYPDAS